MYVSESWGGPGMPVVRITDATVYAAVNGVYADRPDPDGVWLCLAHGPDTISLRLKTAQLECLYQQLAALLTDRAVCHTTEAQLDTISESKMTPPDPQ
jgi:hypothetical protein